MKNIFKNVLIVDHFILQSMVTKNKCSCKVIFGKNNKTRACKSHVYGNFGGKNFCFVHVQKFLSVKAIFIQKIQRGKRCRELLEKIYKKVPFEIQNIISEYLKEEYYIERSSKNFLRILTKKFENISSIIYKLFNNASEDNLLVVHERTDNLYFSLIDRLINIINICLKNWKFISECNVQWIETYLIKLYILSYHKKWGLTIWNGTSLVGLFNYLENNNQLLDNNSRILENLYTRMTSYKNIFNWTFKYIRFNLYYAEIENRLIQDNHIFLNMTEFD